MPVAQWPRGVAISPDGAQVYVANRGANSLQVIDTGTNAVIASVAVGEGLTASPLGHRTSPRCSTERPRLLPSGSKSRARGGTAGATGGRVGSACGCGWGCGAGAAGVRADAPAAGPVVEPAAGPGAAGAVALAPGLGLRLWPRRYRGLCGRLRLDAHQCGSCQASDRGGYTRFGRLTIRLELDRLLALLPRVRIMAIFEQGLTPLERR